jgi:hypothetical protein
MPAAKVFAPPITLPRHLSYDRTFADVPSDIVDAPNPDCSAAYCTSSLLSMWNASGILHGGGLATQVVQQKEDRKRTMVISLASLFF